MDHWTLHRHMFLGEISSGYGCLPCLVVMFQQWTAQFSFLIGRIQLSSKARNFRASIDALAWPYGESEKAVIFVRKDCCCCICSFNF